MMKRVKLILTMVLAASVVGLFLESCSKDNAPGALTLVSLMTDGGIALDGATSASAIPLNAKVIATFNKAVNETTATSATISISVDGATVDATITVAGPVVTIAPNAILATGTTHTVMVSSGLKATDGGAATAGSFTFKTFGPPVVNAPQSSTMLSYFAFNGNMNDSKGTHNATTTTDLTFVEDRFGFAGFAGSFNGTTSIVEIPNADQYLAGPSFTISFWIKAATSNPLKGQFVLGLGAWKGFQFEIAGDWTWVKLASQYKEAVGSDSEDAWFPGNGQTKDNGGWQGWTFQKDVTATGGVGTTYFANKWAHVVVTYDAATKLNTMYINGEKVKQHDFNLWPNGDAKAGITGVTFAGNTTGGGNNLALGFIQASGNRIITDTWADPSDPTNNHFKGLMDDVRFWSTALTAAEVTSLYTAEKP